MSGGKDAPRSEAVRKERYFFSDCRTVLLDGTTLN